ncbi:MAG: ADP-heptose synthase [marine bacterium B5-7]|nr:MAG: ADP-heptose synthase [marine bacterium B5-7]
MLDRYWSGTVERISPESPVPVVDITQTECRMGGAANVAANVVGLGALCSLFSIVGEDDSGRVLAGLISESGIDSRVTQSADVRTIEKLRIVARNQQLLRVDFESRPTHELLAQALEDVTSIMTNIDMLILSDYGKGGLTHIEHMISAAREASVPVVVDPKGGDYQRYRGATLITPNLKEFEQTGGDTSSEEAMMESAHEIIDRYDFDSLLVTRSEKGMTLYRRDAEPIHSPATAREIFDVSGAGDTVAAVVGVALAAGLDARATLGLANRAAGQVVAKFGTAIVDLDTIDLEGLEEFE